MTVGKFCTKEVLITNKESIITEVAQLMRLLPAGQ